LLLHADSQAALAAYRAQPTHALLVTGTRGVGKTTLVQQLAADVLGLTRLQLESYPYYRFLSGKADDVTVDTVRELLGFVALTVPGHTPIARVICIDDAHALSLAAQNALLKLLEEPPERTALILSALPGVLLPTITSRTQHIALQPPSEHDVLRYFTAHGYDDAAIKRAYMLARGNLAQLTQLLSRADTTGQSPLDLVKQALSADAYGRLCLVDSVLKDKQTATEFVDALVVVAQSSLRTALERHGAEYAPAQRWQHIVRAGCTAQAALARSGNQKLVLTELLLSL
jgi:replication-associated recombination protein RarA